MKHAREILFAALLTFLAPFVRAYEMRMWTAMNGKTTEAAYVKYESETQKVVMQKRDGTIIKVHRDSLCDKDWVYVMKYDPSIFEFFVFLGETTCIIRKPDGQKTISIPTRFYASNTKLIRIVQDGKVIIETPFVLSVFPPFSGDKEIETVYRYIEDYQWGQMRQTLSIHVVRKTEYNGSKTPIRPDRMIDINTSSGKQVKWILAKHRFGEIPKKDWWDISEYFKTQLVDNWITLLFDSRIEDDITQLRNNALRLNQLLKQNERFARVSTLLQDKNDGLPSEEPGEAPKHNQKLLATGSGFCISADGYFLTNYHVVQGSKDIRLHTVFGNTSATVVRVDPAVDLALLKADKRGFVPLPFAAESSASLGEDIFTIGFPMPDLQGFSPKMTKGVISSLNGIQDDDVQYQIDASIQPGNSGGPLVNNQGELVGVVVATLKAGLVAEKKGVLPQNVNYAIKKKHVLDFLAQVPACLRSIQTSNQPATGKSATPETIEAVQNSCAMVIVFE